MATRAGEQDWQAARGYLATGDVDAAAPLLLAAARAGHAAAAVEVARMCLHGVGAPLDVAGARDWLARASAAGSHAATCLALQVALGDAVPPDDDAILAGIENAVVDGHPPALLAAAILAGRAPGGHAQATCVALLERGASAGDAIAMQLLVARAADGDGVAPDDALASTMRRRLADRGIAPVPGCTAPSPDAPPAADVLAARPRVAIADGVLSRDECRLLMAFAAPALRRSRTIDPGGGGAVTLQLRTSSDASIDPLQESLALRLVQRRLCAVAGLPLRHAEHLIVLRYAPGEEYRPHRDYLPASQVAADVPAAGNRRRTLCAYLNDVAAGGETSFPGAGLRVEPVPGRALVFDNLNADGQPDPESLHAGLPVLGGVKWLATLWLRERPYRDY